MAPGMIAVLLITAGVISFAMTLVVRALAPCVGLTDGPDRRRKLHEKPTSLGGGLAVYVATAVVLIGLMIAPNPCRAGLQHSSRWVLGMLAAAATLVVLGLLDDRFNLRGRQKLAGQLVIVLCLVVNGLQISRIGMFGWECNLGLLTVPFTVLWLLGAINAINLLDGMDGMATLLGAILAGTFAVLAVMVGRQDVAAVALVFTGGLLGFLRFNLPPASIFLGDAGSMLIGLFLGIMAIKGSMKGPGTVLLAAPLAIWTLPLLDTAAAVLRRKLTGRSIYASDRGHLHHCLMERLGSNTKALWIVATCCLITSAAAMFSVCLKNDFVAMAVGLGVVALLVATGLFGRGEFLLLANSLRKLVRSFLTIRGGDEQAASSHTAVHLQGSARWNEIWEMLMESVEDLCVDLVSLDVNLPLLHESFNASWEKPCQDDTVLDWRVEMPLLIASETVGRIVMVGKADAALRRENILRLLDVCDACNLCVQAIVAQSATSHGPAKPLERRSKRRREKQAAPK
jgi:UDP-GlcNAc:undecaprenyl-phosphate GlcNAc-1-phosphate transferase